APRLLDTRRGEDRANLLRGQVVALLEVKDLLAGRLVVQVPKLDPDAPRNALQRLAPGLDTPGALGSLALLGRELLSESPHRPGHPRPGHAVEDVEVVGVLGHRGVDAPHRAFLAQGRRNEVAGRHAEVASSGERAGLFKL